MPETEAEIKERLEILRKLRSGEIVLKDCPFCGEAAIYRIFNAKFGAMAISCNGPDLKCAGHKCGGSASFEWQAVIDAWNRRV